MNTTLAAITAAGITYNAADFSDPHLDGPTALTVTADGRVFGHLAQWGTCHIGFGQQCVQPPTSAQGYRFFHQGVVDTDAGPLPVGKITLGTGHAPVDGRTDAVAAAAHYDNTGTVVATVRAGEDAHGIWLAGRLVPGLDDSKVDELRRSGVSGDWRGIDNHHELVAALAVNVPGFPVPRTEQLVASGGFGALVAAGIVLRPQDLMPTTPGELRALIAAAVAQEKKRDALVAKVASIRDEVRAERRAKAVAKVNEVRRARALDKALTAAAPFPPKKTKKTDAKDEDEKADGEGKGKFVAADVADDTDTEAPPTKKKTDDEKGAAPFPPKPDDAGDTDTPKPPAGVDEEQKRKRKAAVARAMGGPDPKG